MKITANNQNRLINSGQRIYGLDAMRALLAILGIFLHAGLSHIVRHSGYDLPWYAVSDKTSLFMNWLVCWIHSFRMPAFFFLSGFFSYLIYKKSKLFGLSISRIKRIFVPFCVIWLLPAAFGFSILYLDPSIRSAISSHRVFESLSSLGAYWFLYYLLIFDIASLLIISLAKPLKNNLLVYFEKVKKNKIFNIASITILLAIPFISLSLSSQWLTPTDVEITPQIRLLILYGSFFLLGWCAHTQYQYLISFAKRFWHYLLLGSLIAMIIQSYLLVNFFHGPNEFRLIAVLLYSLSGIVMLLSILGMCLKFLTKRSRVAQYLADSSYWVYLSQITVILFIGSLLAKSHLNLTELYLINVVGTTGICLLTYHLFIRNKKIFRYIDGTTKRIRRKNSEKIDPTVRPADDTSQFNRSTIS